MRGATSSATVFRKNITVFAKHLSIGYQIHRAGDKSIGLRIEFLSGDKGIVNNNFAFSLSIELLGTFSVINNPPPERADNNKPKFDCNFQLTVKF